MTSHRLVLASTSPYRRQLLARLQQDFEVRSPDCDETPLPGESATELVVRLALAKAASIAATRDDNALVIGSDQVAARGDRILTKPGNHARAREQLQAASGESVAFHTGLAVIESGSDRRHSECVTGTIDFRALADAEIDRYLAIEQPWDCAGSIRCEGYAITLFERMRSDDPSTLMGLPLIRLRDCLAAFGFALP